MKPCLLPAMLVVTLPGFADDRSVEFDPNTDFSRYTTFHMREGRIAAKAPELNNSIVKGRIAAALRAQLTAKGLTEKDSAGLALGFHFGSANKQQVRTSKELVWRGIYRDDESSAKKSAGRIEEDVRKLFDKFPSKKK